MDPDTLTTTQAAKLLHCSRQHVVDLCDSGQLPHVKVGRHRRIHRGDLAPFLDKPLRREDERSLWMHYAFASKLIQEPSRIIQEAQQHLVELRSVHPRSKHWHDQWDTLLSQGPHIVLTAMTAITEEADGLRSASPFSGLGLLTQDERTQILTAFNKWWRLEHPQRGAA